MRVGSLERGSICATLDIWMVSSFSTIPPGSPIRGRVWRLATLIPCTIIRESAGSTRNTSPILPLSRPVMTTTLSPFLILSFAIARHSQDLRGQRHDLHESARPQLAGDGAENARADRFALMSDEHGGIAVEADRAAIGATDLFCRANDNRAVYVALFDAAARDRFLHRNYDDIANRCGLALGAAQYFDALDSASAGVVGDVEICLHLNHAASPSFPIGSGGRSTAPSTGDAFPTSAPGRLGATSPRPPSTTQCLRFEMGRLSSI